MTSFFSIVQYVPDPIADERVNVGVIAFEGGKVQCRFLHDWTRTQRFADGHIGFLRDFAAEIDQDVTIGRLDEQRIRRMSTEWTNSIQLTAPRPSILPVAQLLDSIAERWLKDRRSASMRPRDRRHAVALAGNALRRALAHIEQGLGLISVESRISVWGKHEQHQFDYGLQNGSTLLATQGISFEITDLDSLKGQLDRLKWAIDDVQQAETKVPLAVIALRPQQAAKSIYVEQREVLKRLGSEFVPEHTVDAWAEQAVETVLAGSRKSTAVSCVGPVRSAGEPSGTTGT